MARVGYVGLGTMGGRIARRFLAAGHEVRGYNRTRERAAPLEAEGLILCDNPRQVAEGSEYVFSMVTSTNALEAVALGEDGILGGLGADQVYVDMSTVSPEFSRRLAAQVRERGAHMLDGPVSGSVETLEAGRLSVMVGGDPEVFERAREILLVIGPVVNHVGPNGQAVLMKIAVNLGLAVQMLALSEALLLAERGGIDRKTAFQVLCDSVVASPMIKYRGPFVFGLPEEAWFDVQMMQKDLLLALEAARRFDVPMPTTAVTNEMLTAARGMGYADEDFAAIFHTLARMAGSQDV
ncbi:MAG: NAD(P)-dependent oxidoreductase [Candidatus Dormibacteraceae bacterium]